MNKFLFKSPDSDFQKLLQQVNKNILYVTHMEDKILKIVTEIELNARLKRQTESFYEEDATRAEDDDKESD